MPGDDKPVKRRRGSQYGHGHTQDHVTGSGGASEDLLGGAVDNPGAKHWSDEEKTKFFIWLLGSDEHWEQFGTKMNTCFREVRKINFQKKNLVAPPRTRESSPLEWHLSSFHCISGACADSSSVIRYDRFIQFPLVPEPLYNAGNLTHLFPSASYSARKRCLITGRRSRRSRVAIIGIWTHSSN